MILTRTFLNVRRDGARKLLGSPQAMHAAILSGFPPGMEAARPLWRIDSDDRLRPALYVLSAHRPDFTHIEEQAGWPSHGLTNSMPYDPLLDALQAGTDWAFRLTANPVHRATINAKQKVVAHVTVAQQIAWLVDRQELLGAEIGSVDEPSFTLTNREVRRFRREGATVTLGTATFQGVLRVRNPEVLRAALTTGIGRAKAYGCGLMTLAPV